MHVKARKETRNTDDVVRRSNSSVKYIKQYILRARSVDHKSTGSQSSGSQSTGSQIHWTGIRWIHHRIGVSNNNFKIWLYYQKSHQNHKRESKKSVPGILLYYIATVHVARSNIANNKKQATHNIAFKNLMCRFRE